MTKQEMIDIIKTLSALESWAFSTSKPIPDYLLEHIDRDLKVLEAEVLK